MSRDIAPFGVRMPVELKEHIEAAAAHNRRSLNSEIVSRLQHSFLSPLADLSAIPSGALLHEVIARYGKDIKIEIGGTAAEDLKAR